MMANSPSDTDELRGVVGHRFTRSVPVADWRGAVKTVAINSWGSALLRVRAGQFEAYDTNNNKADKHETDRTCRFPQKPYT